MMLKKHLIIIFSLIVLGCSYAQAQSRYFTKTSKITFFSEAPLEDIEAINKTASAVLDPKTGAIQFSVLMKGFEFEKAMMQEHFNENYVESDKFPKAEFKGTILNNSEIDYTKPGTYKAKVKGQLTIHGVTKEIETNGNIVVNNDHLKAESVFNVLVADYNIKVPAIVKDNIAKKIKITVDAKLESL
jgi:polyisoprenoid-binding protein YceI